MTPEQCNQRASACAENAAIAPGEAMAAEFMELAAQWRAMAVRDNYLGQLSESAPIPRP